MNMNKIYNYTCIECGNKFQSDEELEEDERICEDCEEDDEFENLDDEDDDDEFDFEEEEEEEN